MRNLKKIIAVAISLVMLFSVAAISASADAAPKLALFGKAETSTTTTGYYELAVHLTDAGAAVKGIEGVITYDTTKFAYAGVVLNKNFVAAGNPDVESVLADDAGKIKFVGLTDASSVGEWFVLRFTTVGTGSATFGLTAKGADTNGYVTVDVAGDDTTVKEAATNDIMTVMGAQIKKIDDATKQDIRFRVQFNETLFASTYGEAKIVEYGVMMMFTKRLNYGELTYDMIGNPDVTGLAVAKAAGTDLNPGAEFYANLNNMTVDALGVRISARAYAKLDNGNIIYSQNCNGEFETSSGYTSKSVVGVAKKAAQLIIDAGGSGSEVSDSAITAILAKDSVKGEDRNTLLGYVNAYYSVIRQ